MQEPTLFVPADLNLQAQPKPTPPRRSRGLLWALTGGFIVIVLGGGYLAHAQGWIAIPFLPEMSNTTTNTNALLPISNTSQNRNTNTNSRVVLVENDYCTIEPENPYLALFEFDDEPVSDGQLCWSVQYFQVSQLRNALATYRDGIGEYPGAGHYPTTLNELLPELERQKNVCLQAQASETNTQIGLGPISCDNYDNVSDGLSLIDMYTQQPFGYQPTSDNYTLSYVMRLFPELDEQERGIFTDGVNTTDAKDEAGTFLLFGAGDDVDTDGDHMSDRVERGLSNTDPNNPDTDGDGANDYLEFSGYKTDPLKPDTDGDGFSDAEEVCNGYDPLGPGKQSTSLIEAYGRPELCPAP